MLNDKIFFLLASFGSLLWAQVLDTIRLSWNEPPFPIHPSKRISEEELRYKKEGYFVTGLPEIERNPINGLGLGANFYLYNNKTQADPFFPYTPYRARYTGFFKVFQSGKWQGALNMDFPYVLGTRWRIRVDAVFENDPNWQYYGIGANTLQPLRFVDKRTGQVRTYRRFSEYFENLAVVRPGDPLAGEAAFVTDRHYNELDYTENLYNLGLERTFAGGRGRLFFGYEFLRIRIKDYFNRPAEEAFDLEGQRLRDIAHGRTKLTEDYLGLSEGNPWQQFNIAGYRGGDEGILAFAVMYDTRDFEPDPTQGVFLEYSHEHSRPWLFSEFSFDKNLLQVQAFTRVLPRQLRRAVLATNLGLGYIWGTRVPFYEAFDLSSQAEAGGTEVLGGARALRGFREYRFTGPLTLLFNVELRTRLYQTYLLRQHLAFDIVPFFDAGRVWNRLREISLSRYKYSYGAGARVAWNQSTILRADFGFSTESTQFFFGFGHIF